MAKQYRIPAIVSWGGAYAAGLILLIAWLFPSADRDQIAPSSWFRLTIRPDYCELLVPLGGDIASCPPGMTPGWSSQGYVGLPSAAWIAVREAVGVPVTGLQLQLQSKTWLLTLVLLLPGAWRVVIGRRVKRSRLLAGRCTDCGYDLRGSADDCPECGATRPTERAVVKCISARMWRRRPVFTALAMLFVLLAGAIIGAMVKSHDERKPVMILKPPPTEGWTVAFDRGYLIISNHGWTRDWHSLPKEGWLGLRARVNPSQNKTYRLYAAYYLYPLVISLMLPLAWWVMRWRDLPGIAARSCRWCWFDMEGATGPCPRCGKLR